MMEQPARLFALKSRKPASDNPERTVLMQSLAQTRTLLSQAYSCFDTASDPELIESYVFEINALQSRYNYLLRQAKQLEESL